MAISFGNDGDDDMMATINTTPLVDIMLVLLIIFLITVPVATHTVPVQLPKETSQPTRMTPRTITLAVDRDGGVFWNEERIPDPAHLRQRLASAATAQPQPEIQIRGDGNAPYAFVGKVLDQCQRAGIAKVGFVTEPVAQGR